MKRWQDWTRFGRAPAAKRQRRMRGSDRAAIFPPLYCLPLETALFACHFEAANLRMTKCNLWRFEVQVQFVPPPRQIALIQPIRSISCGKFQKRFEFSQILGLSRFYYLQICSAL